MKKNENKKFLKKKNLFKDDLVSVTDLINSFIIQSAFWLEFGKNQKILKVAKFNFFLKKSSLVKWLLNSILHGAYKRTFITLKISQTIGVLNLNCYPSQF